MVEWKNRVKLKHLFTEKEDLKSIRESMKNIADELKKHDCFKYFNSASFYKIPKGDSYFGPLDYANRMLSDMYNYADQNSIWIE